MAVGWRLGWTFACTEHHCLLTDACPHCGAVQRRRTHVGDPFRTRPVRPPRHQRDRPHPERCDADLTAATVTMFDADHPVIHAQRAVQHRHQQRDESHPGSTGQCRSRGSTYCPTSGPSLAGHWHTPRHRISSRHIPPTSHCLP